MPDGGNFEGGSVGPPLSDREKRLASEAGKGREPQNRRNSWLTKLDEWGRRLGLRPAPKDAGSEVTKDQLAGESRDPLKDIGKAIAGTDFRAARELLGKLDSLEGVDQEELQERARTLVKDRARELATTGDGEGRDFVQCVSHLNKYIEAEDLPEEAERSPKIADAVRDHAVDMFADHDNKPDQIGRELGKFSDLNLLDRDALSESSEFRDAVDQRLLASFEKRSFTGFAEALIICRNFDISYQPEGQTLSELRQHALSWLDEAFTKLETGEDEDPITPLELLSQFMDSPRIMGLELSEDQVRERPDLLPKVQQALKHDALPKEQDGNEDDEPRIAMVAALDDIFGDKQHD